MSAEADHKVSIYVADNSPIIRERLINLLIDLQHVEVVGEAGTVAELMLAIPRLKPDIVILDIRLPGGGIAALNYLKKSLGPVVVIILTNELNADYYQLFLNKGADYVFDKFNEFDKVLPVIEDRLPAS